MDLQNIQDQLNTEFAKSETRIIFWFDDKGEYEDEVSELQLGDVKLHILDGTNWLYSKYLLNEEDKESKYLVYAAFAKPSDAENPLADMYYYSTPYYTDRVSQMSQEIGIDNRFKEHLSQYANFWKNKHRIEKFKELGIDHYNAQTIDIGLIAVLTDVKTPNFEEVVKQLMLGDNEKYFKALDDNGLTDKFWELCEKFFGYKSEKPNIDDLSACMILTYASSTLKATVPEAMRTYILKKRNDVVVFIRNIMDNVNYQDAYDKLVERIDKSLRFVTRIQDGLKKDVEKKKDSFLQLADIFACDAFAGLDDIIIDWALEQLNDEILDAQIDGLNIAQVADQRMSKAYHYSERYKNEYTTIKYAYLMMKSVSLMEFSSDIKTLVTNYQKESYLIDSYYRWFYYAYDQIEDNSKFSDVRQRVENIYANTYLQKITPKWNENFTNEEMNATDLPKQEDFYKHYLRGYDGKQRIIVIISDAFRYECARELFGKLELDEKCTPKMECMLSCLPSVTSVGMASLLPHKEMQVDGSLNVTVGVSFLLVAAEGWLEGKVAVSGLLAVVSMACVLKLKSTAFVSKRLSEKFGKLWIAAEVILFVLVGAAVDIRYTLQAGLAAIAMILLALLFRTCGVLLCVAKTNLSWKERAFCVIAYLPKATVQAAIGSVPLAAGLACGKIVLSVAVMAIIITAPLGAFGMDQTYRKLLHHEQ